MTYWHVEDTDTLLYTMIVGLNITSYHTLTFTPPVDVANAFLYTNGAYSGFISVKHSYNTTYKSIRSYSLNPTGYLGDLVKDTVYTLNFKIRLPNDDDLIGPLAVPIYVGFGENIKPLILDSNCRWHTNTTDYPFLWAKSSEERVLITWGHIS